jgi:hypothetical protein
MDHKGPRHSSDTDSSLALEGDLSIRTILETSHQNQSLLTPEGKIIYVNATALASINGRLEDVVGRDFWETPWFTGTPGMPEKVREAVALVAAGETAKVSMPLNMPTGNRIYEFSMRPVMDSGGKVIALVPEAVEIRPHPCRRGIAAGTENGSDRPANGRRSSRLQQSADSH